MVKVCHGILMKLHETEFLINKQAKKNDLENESIIRLMEAGMQ